MLVAALLENLWLVLRWAVVTRPRWDGRDLPEEFTLTTFCDWIRNELEAELGRRWYVEANGVRVPEMYGQGVVFRSGSTLRPVVLYAGSAIWLSQSLLDREE